MFAVSSEYFFRSKIKSKINLNLKKNLKLNRTQFGSIWKITIYLRGAMRSKHWIKIVN